MWDCPPCTQEPCLFTYVWRLWFHEFFMQLLISHSFGNRLIVLIICICILCGGPDDCLITLYSLYANIWDILLLFILKKDKKVHILPKKQPAACFFSVSFVHLDQRPVGRCGPRAPKQQSTRGTQRPFGRCCCFVPRHTDSDWNRFVQKTKNFKIVQIG